jgi:hypothetical protein
LGYIGLYNKPPPPVINGLDYINKGNKSNLNRWTKLLTDENKSKTDTFTQKPVGIVDLLTSAAGKLIDDLTAASDGRGVHGCGRGRGGRG